MERAIKDHQEEFGKAIATAPTEHGPMVPMVKITLIRENSWKIMAYIARQQLATNGQCVSEAQVEHIHDQAEERALEGAQKNAKTVPTPQLNPTPRVLSPPCNSWWFNIERNSLKQYPTIATAHYAY
jgi:hypothetical protein